MTVLEEVGREIYEDLNLVEDYQLRNKFVDIVLKIDGELRNNGGMGFIGLHRNINRIRKGSWFDD